MKAEFELTIDEKTGDPKIKFRHHDKNNSLDQKILKRFLTEAKEKGIELGHSGGYLESGTSNSWEDYEITIKKIISFNVRII